MKGCLSDFALDRLLAGELDGELDGAVAPVDRDAQPDHAAAKEGAVATDAAPTRAEVETHLEACDACLARKQALETEYAAFEQGRFVAGEVARVKQRARDADASTSGPVAASRPSANGDAPGSTIGARARRRFRGPVGGAFVALAAALLVVVLLPGREPQDRVRLKSGLALEAYHRDEAGEVVPLESGATARTDEAVQLFARLPAEAHVAIVGVDAEGVVSLYHPPGSSSEGALGGGRAAMGRWQMPSSIVFSTLGLERLFLVACEGPLDEAQLREAMQQARAPMAVARLGIDCPQATFDVNVAAGGAREAPREEGAR